VYIFTGGLKMWKKLTVLLCSIIGYFFLSSYIYVPSLLDSDNFVLIAHRGASKEAPENTLAAYQFAKKAGADYIEIDLQMTQDGKLVAMHDSSVDRTTDGSGKVGDMTLAEIKKLDAGSWFNEEYPEKADKTYSNLQVPTLQEIFDAVGNDANYYIETKKGDLEFAMEQKLVALLEENGLLDKSQPIGKVVIQSFDEESLKFIHDLNSEIPLIKLLYDEEVAETSSTRLEDICEYAIGIGASYTQIDKEYIKNASKKGLLIHLFTVDNTQGISKIKSAGATGIFTNDILEIKEAAEGASLH
jgi:glycerophosphoryl diester phosphodiesterase